jgi:OTU domain-containing protein 4
LETAGYYRKHTARDPSSLFRVVSEHVFDIQLYHDKVREDCANYLEKNRKDYEKEMDKNFYYYLSNLRKLRTPGTLLELRALAHCYKRNVMMFEPFTAGKWYIEEDEYHVNKPILVFYTADKHFDSIYTKEDIELAAKCQGLIFEILYKDVFQLADVSYAVERMLHDQNEETTKPLKDDPEKYETVSGKIIEFDSHQTTSCVLENSLMCHFHNRSNFREFVDSYSANLIPNPRKVANADSSGRPRKPLDGFLYDMTKSCVRQLLDEKITPFPYKVAKALDRSIYRNIEFDLWNDNRKELRMKWMEGNPMDVSIYFSWFLMFFGRVLCIFNVWRLLTLN